MATNQPPEEEGDRCVTAFEAVSEVALEHCESREAIVRFASKYVGLDPEIVDPNETAGGVTDGVCDDFAASREWVLLRTTDLIADEGEAPPDAVEQAWDELSDECDDLGFSL